MLARGAGAQEASPVAGWSYTDLTGKTVTLPKRPERIAAMLNNAAALWDFGIKPVAVFGWTASNHPDGDHVAWGNIAVDEIEIVSDTEGNVELEKLMTMSPDLIVTWTWDKNDPRNATNGFPAEVLDRANEIAPIILLNQGDPNDVELARVEELVASLGVDLDAPELAAARADRDWRIEELKAIAAAKPGLAVLFGSFGTEEGIYIASPDYVGDLGYVRSLGLKLANDGSPDATQYWEQLSYEQALKYPSDLLYIDQYGPSKTAEALQAHPTLKEHPAVKAGQTGPWLRDLPLTYSGQAEFLDTILVPLRTAQKVS
jgi:iron complex transport system substrate-binding protein